ncbi:MAG: Rieske 2Fe-2S domain-containing protein [Leptospiraceae bacterium]|nr:Rieske 2Fe-2S domain-containing protein [Leptospiraceae bacterium]
MRKHLYNQPIPVLETIPEHPRALRLDLPEPPNGDPADQAFLYRIEGRVVGFFNRCGHVRLPMDLDDGKFFDLEGMIICRVHGARFDEKEGHCIMGPSPVGLYRLLLQGEQHSEPVPGKEDDTDSSATRRSATDELESAKGGDSDISVAVAPESKASRGGSLLILGWEGPVAPEQH